MPVLLMQYWAITNAGGEILFSSSVYNRISAKITLEALESIAALAEVSFIYPEHPMDHGSNSLAINSSTNKMTEAAGFFDEKKPAIDVKKLRPRF